MCEDLGRMVMEDLEGLVLQGGAPLELLDWEREVIDGAMQPNVSRIGISIPRKNGKTELCAGLSVSALCGALAQEAGEVVFVASSFEQATIAFRSVLAMLDAKIEEDPARWRSEDHANRARITDRKSKSILKCIGSDPRRAHGLRPHFVLLDELAQWPATRDRMMAALTTAAGIREMRMLAIGTKADSEQHVFSKWLRNADYTYVRSAHPDADPLDIETYAACNPSWHAFPLLRKAIMSEIEVARREPSELPRLRALRGNLGLSDVEQQVLIDPSVWQACETADLPPREGRPIFGVDLGGTAAMSGLAAFWPATGRLEALAAFPELPGLLERGLADGVGQVYQQMAEEGDLLQLGQRVVPPEGLLEEGLRRYGPPVAVVSDRWRDGELLQALDASSFPPCPFVPRGQGFKDGSEDVRLFRRAAIDQRIAVASTLLVRSAMSEARVVSDAAANHKLAKSTEGGRRAKARDDVAAAIILAVAHGERGGAQPVKRRRYAV